MQWENVYVFISSTFNDMHAERDYLVKRVFPQLSAWCEERKLRLVDIDLRWGVSEADATQNKRVVQVCLDRIDACRPFFLCFLGQRRGWVPQESDIGGETYESFPKLLEKHYSGSASVTEMEILHALIDPLHNGILRLADGGTQAAEPVKHALFFLRDPEYLKEISHPDTHKIYSNEAEADQAKADTELRRWREEVIPQTGQPVFDYSANWQQNESTPEIALPPYVPTTAPQGSEIWKAAFDRWAKIWESNGVKVDDNGEITDGTELTKARAYNQTFTAGRLSDFQHGGVALADIIIEQLKAAITERFGERVEQALTPLQHELDQQAQFLQMASDSFIEREGDFEEINTYLTDGETRPFGLTAYAGMGKTSFLAHFIDTYQSKEANESLHYRFIGGSDDSVSVERLIRSLLSELKERGKISSDIPANTADMLNKFPELLREAGQKGKTILIIDALNQLESGMTNLSWIPAVLPDVNGNIKLYKKGE